METRYIFSKRRHMALKKAINENIKTLFLSFVEVEIPMKAFVQGKSATISSFKG